MKRLSFAIPVLSALVATLATAQETRHPGPSDDAPVVTYVANEGFLVAGGGRKVLVDALFAAGVDPFLRPPAEPLTQLAQASGVFAGVDLLLVSHSHADHFDAGVVVAHMRHNQRCTLVAHTQVVARLRNEAGFLQIRHRVREVALEPGGRRRITLEGLVIDVLCLPHVPYEVDGRDVHDAVRNLAFVVTLGRTRFLHMGDAALEHAAKEVNRYPFADTPVDLLFLDYVDRSAAAQELIARTIKPSWVVAMHVPPIDLQEEAKKVRAVYPHAVVFRRSMEARALPLEADFHSLSGAYLGQPLPGSTPVVFAPGIVSTDANEHSAPSFSPGGDEVFWWANRAPGPDNTEWETLSMTMRRDNGRWSAPRVTPFGPMVALSPDGRRAYFPRQKDIWIAEKQGAEWSEPRCLSLVARSPELREAFMPQVARNGTLYFLARLVGPRNDLGIYRAGLVNGDYAKPEPLPRSINMPPFFNWAPFIAPDESYLLFSSNRRDPDRDGGDLYIARRTPAGGWTDPISLGEPVNSPAQEVFPGLSPDGEYLFFCRDTPGRQNEVYWVTAASVAALPPRGGSR